MNHSLFPGPRPLGVDQADLLVGREDDIARLEHATLNRRLVNVTAPSGTGKSSLLTAGLLPRLSDHKVVVLRAWADVVGDDPGGYLYSVLRQAFAETGQDPELGVEWPGDPGEGLTLLARRYGVFSPDDEPRYLIAILDQVEELMRLDPDSAQLLLAAVEWAAKVLPFRFILSLRTEFKEELAALESALPPRLWQGLRINALPPERAVGVITRPLGVAREGGADAWNLGQDAVDEIAGLWREAVAKEQRLGLLHLQATLWVIEREATPRPGETLGVAALETRSPFFGRLRGGEDDPTMAIGEALEQYLRYALGDIASSMEDARGAAETVHAMARFVGALSAAGYKVHRRTDDLFLDSFEEVERMRWKKDRIQVLREVWRTARLTERPATASQLAAAAADAGFGPTSLGSDRSLLSGRLADADPLTAFCELTEVFERALRWLGEAGVVRVTRDRDGHRLVGIIHDGYGAALNGWAEAARADPRYYTQALTGEIGAAVLTDMVVEDCDVQASRWPGCSIEGATFRNVTFRGCDLRGTLFFGCRFENVRFEGCYGPGLLFIKPTIAGASGLVIKDSVTRTITVTQSMVEDGSAGLVLDGIDERVSAKDPWFTSEDRSPGVDGMFLDDFSGPWTVRRSRFRHLLVSGLAGRRSAGPGRIEDSEVTLVHLDGQASPVVCSGASVVRHVDVATLDDRLVTESGSDYRREH